MTATVLGSGTSHGVPMLGCACATCRSADPRDTRWRSSIVVQEGSTRLLVDAGPEFRLQALRAGIDRLDAVLLTHAHADHAHGLDDVRPLCGDGLPIYGNSIAISEIRVRFAYAFEPLQEGGGLPKLRLVEVDVPFRVGELLVTPVPVAHGLLPILGWRFDAPGSRSLAYVTDASELGPEAFRALGGVRDLFVGGLRERPHPTHFSFEQAAAAAEALGVERAWITHISHRSTHAALENWCAVRSARVALAPACDGLRVECAETPSAR